MEAPPNIAGIGDEWQWRSRVSQPIGVALLQAGRALPLTSG